ncbi:MAG: DEAD/DEAH box helicase [Chloroflexi bacterium]|nr:DEAD/DEAH box helicase [Chloroflexota bacterium]
MLEASPAAPASNTPATTRTFAELGVSADLVGALARGGIVSPFPVQELTIPDALAGRDLCGKARTGSGKTLAFGLPLLEKIAKSAPRRPRALVLVPTRELASQVANELAPIAAVRRVRIAAIYGGASLNRQADHLRAGVDIVIATPGRLNDLLQRGALTVADVQVAVLDEADQMADMGFMPQVERILDRIEQPHQTLLFSATLDGDVDRLVKRYQHDPVFHEAIVAEDDEQTMEHRFIGVEESEKTRVAAAIAAGPNLTLMFVRTQHGADRLARNLEREGVAAGVLHGGLSQPKRERALRAFSKGEVRVLVATNIAARGIHVDGVDIVVHHDPPEDSKTYLHRSGRTARAGASGMVVTLVSHEQMRDVAFLKRDTGVREAVVPMDASDPRLGDLAGWAPPLDDLSARVVTRESSIRPQSNFRGRPQQRSGGGNGQHRRGPFGPGGSGDRRRDGPARDAGRQERQGAWR